MASAPDQRRALLALSIIVPAPTIGVLAAMYVAPGTPLGTGIFIASKLWVAAVPLLWRLLVDRRPVSLSPARQGGLLTGAVLGLAISAVIVAAYLLLGPHFIDAAQVRAMAERSGIATPAVYLGAALYWIAVNSVLEEYVYRWFMFEKSETLVGAKSAVALSAVFFTVHHVFALAAQFDWVVTLLGSLGVLVGGVLWSWCYRRYRSIWPGYVSHAIVDVAVFGIGWLLIVQPSSLASP